MVEAKFMRSKIYEIDWRKKSRLALMTGTLPQLTGTLPQLTGTLPQYIIVCSEVGAGSVFVHNIGAAGF
jgi:hypothetical protein